MSYNTRIAPSPTGDMHFGTLRTAYFNYLAAKSSGGKFILRIDDTDFERNDDTSIDLIFKSLDWLGLDFDDLYYQSDRKKLYLNYAELLVNEKFARKENNGAIILNYKMEYPLYWNDINHSNPIIINDEDRKLIDNLVLIKGDEKLNSPSYNFASVVDDIDMNINLIIRGVDHIPNTSKQVAIWFALSKIMGKNYNDILPKFSHIGLIHYNGKKLSKRDKLSSIKYYMEKNYHSEAVLNFLLRMGWGPYVDDKSTSLINKETALKIFLEKGKMRNSPANMDLMKLDSFDRKYKAIEENKIRDIS